MAEPAEDPPKLTLQRFTSSDCGVCNQMKKARTVERFLEEHLNVTLDDRDLGLSMNETRADELEIDGIPALVWLDADGNLLLKHEGGLTAIGMTRLYRKVLKASEDGDLGVVSRGKRRRRA